MQVLLTPDLFKLLSLICLQPWHVHFLSLLLLSTAVYNAWKRECFFILWKITMLEETIPRLEGLKKRDMWAVLSLATYMCVHVHVHTYQPYATPLLFLWNKHFFSFKISKCLWHAFAGLGKNVFIFIKLYFNSAQDSWSSFMSNRSAETACEISSLRSLQIKACSVAVPKVFLPFLFLSWKKASENKCTMKKDKHGCNWEVTRII